MLYHFLAGFFIFLLLYLSGVSRDFSMRLVFIIALAKEAIYDLTANLNNLAIFEPIKDIGFTLLGAAILYLLFAPKAPVRVRVRSKKRY